MVLLALSKEMTMKGHLPSIVLILLIATTWGGCSSQPTFSRPAPDFTLDRLDGDIVGLSDSEDPVVVPPCGCSSQFDFPRPASDATSDNLGGETVTLSDLRGQVVVLDFWATWCGLCVEKLDHLQQVLEDYADHRVVVLAINVEESPEEVAAFVEDHGYTFTVLLDQDGSVTDAYGVQVLPHTVVVDRDGEMSIPAHLDEELNELLGK
jgi:peroxiredoxin